METIFKFKPLTSVREARPVASYTRYVFNKIWVRKEYGIINSFGHQYIIHTKNKKPDKIGVQQYPYNELKLS